MYQNVINRRAQRNVNEYDEIIERTLSGRTQELLCLLWSTVHPAAAPTFSEFSDNLDSKWHMVHWAVCPPMQGNLLTKRFGVLWTSFLKTEEDKSLAAC